MKTAIYSRVSTKTQSLESQENEILKFCSTKGWIDTKVYRDIDSGFNFSRDGLNQMIKDAQSRVIERIVCLRVDRLGRSVAHILVVIGMLDIALVPVIFITDNINTRELTPQSRLSLHILLATAQYEGELSSPRIKLAQQYAKSQGVHLGRKAAHSVTTNDVLELRCQGFSLRAVARHYDISLSSVQHLLKSN